MPEIPINRNIDEVELSNKSVPPNLKDKMAQKKDSKPPQQSKTIITFGLLFIAGLLQAFGVDLGLELSPDAGWISVGTSIVGILLRLVTGQPIKFTRN